MRTIASPVGPITLVATATGLREIRFDGESVAARPGSSPILDAAEAQLHEYFAGTRRRFDLPLEPQGSEFQIAVWKVLASIDYGTTISYGEEARRLGDPKKARAVGAANGQIGRAHV